VTAGLSAGDSVVGTGAGFVKDGETVRIAPVPGASASADTQTGA
jgi:hypothetical protein